MQVNRFTRYTRLAGAVAVTASAVLAGVASSGVADASAAAAKTAPAASRHHTPVDLTGLSAAVDRQTVKNLTPDGKPQVGTDTVYDMTIYAADGTAIGSQHGETLIVFISPVNGDIYVHQRDVVQIAGGTLTDDGLVNVLAGFRGTPQYLYARGVSGALAGLSGVYQEIPEHAVLPPKIWQAAAEIHLSVV
ncbi:uncharacterized protein (DUF2147 family) [Catenulispora sp. MAP5-51]|uniref:allene oxide cyclase barrel-like domain-containing protein n=1 Tax=Catenulispora sp. MAP5-51 TaxID=3156298 RepID=UPI0035182F62